MKTLASGTSFGIAGIVLAAVGCITPKGEPIQGSIASTLEAAIERGTASFDHTDWDEILQRYAVEEGRRFDYAGLKREQAKLDAYLERLAEVELSSLSRNELFALMVNAYNAYTVRTILDRVEPDGTYTIASIRDIPNVFGREAHRVGGFRLSLDNIEHNILRPFFKDPRIHFAVNCASASCPPLPTRAFQGETLDEQLERAAGSVLADPAYVRVEDNRLRVTRILDWYRSDFVDPEFQGSEEDLPAFIRRYASDGVREWIDSQGSTPSVSFLEYDWSLNRAS